jgi:hypothetical protein
MIDTQNNTVSDSLVQKIQKILALTNSDNPHESDLAMARAQELCIKYNIDLAAIQLEKPEESKVEPIIREDLELDAARKSITQTYVTDIIQNFFGTKVLYHGNRWSGQKLIFIGTKQDIENSKYINSYLNAKFMELWRNYYKNTPNVRLEERGSYISGLARGLSDKLQETQKKTENFESFGVDKDKVSNQYGLMVVEKKERINQTLKEMFPKLGTYYGGGSSRHYNNSYESGKAAGRTISLNKAIGN